MMFKMISLSLALLFGAEMKESPVTRSYFTTAKFVCLQHLLMFIRESLFLSAVSS